MKTDTENKFKMHKLVSMLITLFGIILMAYMIVAEGEPGAIPLLLMVVGGSWYFITQYRIRLQQK